MTDHPILFSGPMVRALLEGRKTQTRRIVSPQNLKFFNPETGNLESSQRMIERAFSYVRNLRMLEAGGWNWQAEALGGDPFAYSRWQARSKVLVGDILWGRETWAVSTIYDGCRADKINPDRIPLFCGIRYAATDARLGIKDRPSIHMPRWASRLTLTVTEVRLQRLQYITKRDAIAEGVQFDEGFNGYTVESGTHYHPDDPRQSYRSLWSAINGDEGPKSWDANPWVLAYSFDVRYGNIDKEGGAS
ncbi:hypothetical protein [Elstera sp.]|uniref:hypothetical protein n=1 Tax=Elstera sp. TaxID=1916664 RepID=UPI0037C02F8F